jgi:hypothetical protein
MIDLNKYRHLFSTDVAVSCADGARYEGYWSEWFSVNEVDWDVGEQPRESILIVTADNGPFELYVDEIERITEIREKENQR